MKYKVITVMDIGENSAVAISPRPKDLKIGLSLLTDSNDVHEILSVGLGGNPDDFDNVVDLMVKGHFSSKEVSLVNVK